MILCTFRFILFASQYTTRILLHVILYDFPKVKEHIHETCSINAKILVPFMKSALRTQTFPKIQ